MPNRLAQETSPYLQQHADNPVDWYPWGEAALGRAHAEDRPILLSIGYSACHWCHVMAHESFEDPEVAERMNRLFVNIKVDREERPDLDQIYQLAHQLLTRRPGGWPLTVFLTPNGKPFFAGTYFPKTSRYGLPGFPELLERVVEAYRERRREIEEQNNSLLAVLASTVPEPGEPEEKLSARPIERAVAVLAENFDSRFGGFGQAPKFPHASDLALLLRRFAEKDDTQARDMALFTLRKMAEGGIYDQLGGGFSRYSVDAYWNIPHFEKMLYDNGPLLALYADAWRISADPLFMRTAAETAGWVMREMQAPEGGYYSSLDADSEHEEGKFYVWSRDEVAGVLDPEEYDVVARHYGLEHEPNFEERHWHLYVAKPLERVAEELGEPLPQCERRLQDACRKLRRLREDRVRPGRDEKVLTSWNALMIRGMARAAWTFGESEWLISARKALDFLRRHLWQNGRLLATYKDGRAHLNAYLDDYAFLIEALLSLVEADFRTEDLDFARELADVLLDQFEDKQNGGFFFTSNDHEPLILRPKPGHDNATPSGNGVAAFALQRLGHLLGEARYLESAERALRLFYLQMEQQPGGCSTLLAALDEHLRPPHVVIIRGPAEEAAAWHVGLASRFDPRGISVTLAGHFSNLPAALDKPETEHVNAWVCSGVKCLPPVLDFEDLKRVCKESEFN